MAQRLRALGLQEMFSTLDSSFEAELITFLKNEPLVLKVLHVSPFLLPSKVEATSLPLDSL